MTIVDEHNFISNEFSELGPDLETFLEKTKVWRLADFCKQEIIRHNELLLVDTQTLLAHPELIESFKIVMNTYLGVIFFHKKENQKAHDWIEGHSFYLNKIIGQYSFPLNEIDKSILNNQLIFFNQLIDDQKKLQSQMMNFSQELDKVLQNAELEMMTAKKIHETLLPKRKEEIKGLNFLNKYSVGDANGGEFFDLINENQNVYQVFIACDSYLISSALIGVINSHKTKGFNPLSFLAEAKLEVEAINTSKKKKSHVEINVIHFDTNQLTITAYGSQANVFSSKSGYLNLESSYKLSKGERIVLFSPGFISNWHELKISPNLEMFLNNNNKMSQSELLTELFLQESIAKKDQTTRDATVVVVEVNRHGIHQV